MDEEGGELAAAYGVDCHLPSGDRQRVEVFSKAFAHPRVVHVKAADVAQNREKESSVPKASSRTRECTPSAPTSRSNEPVVPSVSFTPR